MPGLKDVSIRQKLRAVIVLTSAVALLLACVSFMGYALVTARSQLVRELQSMADIVGLNSAAAIVFMDPESARETLSALGADSRVQDAWIIETDGRLFAEYRRRSSEPRSFDRYLSPGVYREKDGMIVSRPILTGDEQVGVIVVSADLGHAYRSLKRYGVIAGWVLGVSLAVAFALSTRLERVISRPLLHLTETAAKISSHGDYSARAERESDDEIGQLIDSFNEMLGEIEERDVVLQEVNERLEDRVQERTEELEREVQVRARTESDLRASLEEKDVLLKEIHHRVKNNLQVISSLLNLQATHMENEQAKKALTTSQDRLRSIALVHEMFYQSEDLARIDLAPYLRSTTSYLLSAYGVDLEKVQVAVDCSPMNVVIDTAIPLGLIAHELTSNALKYAFPEGRRGVVRVELQKRGDSVELRVADDGVGLPDHVRWDQPSSLGLQLVNSLTRQLRGKIELKPEKGTCFSVKIHAGLFKAGDR